jgi:hypothetical protein
VAQWRHDTQHKAIQHNDTQHIDIQHNTQNNGVVMLSVIYFVLYAVYRKQTEYADYRNTECHYAECHYAECRGAGSAVK